MHWLNKWKKDNKTWYIDMTTVFTLKSCNKKYIEIILELENGIISCQNKLPKKMLYYLLINISQQDILDYAERYHFYI